LLHQIGDLFELNVKAETCSYVISNVYIIQLC